MGDNRVGKDSRSNELKKRKREKEIIGLKAWRIRKDCNGTPLQYPCLENPRDGGAW